MDHSIEYTVTEGSSPLEASIFNLKAVRLAGDFDPQISITVAALKQKKQNVKKMLISSLSNRLTLEAILDDEDRISVKEADEKLKSTVKKLKVCKANLDDTKKNMHALCETAENAYLLLKSRITELQKNMISWEEKKKVLENMKHKNNGVKKEKSAEEKQVKEKQILAMIDKCQDCIDKNKLQVRQLEMAISRVEDKIDIIENLHDQPVDMFNMENMERYRSLKSMIEKVGGVKVNTVDDDKFDKLHLEFDCQKKDVNNDYPKLLLTVTFKLDYFKYPQITHAKVNIVSLDVKDILDEAISSNDLVALVSQLKIRWLSHMPLFSEITQLQNRYAIDWIQEEGVLRVMAGKGGCVVCTLSIPPTYPVHGTVNLIDMKGCNMEALKIQANTQFKTLKEWAEFLELKFGKP